MFSRESGTPASASPGRNCFLPALATSNFLALHRIQKPDSASSGDVAESHLAQTAWGQNLGSRNPRETPAPCLAMCISPLEQARDMVWAAIRTS